MRIMWVSGFIRIFSAQFIKTCYAWNGNPNCFAFVISSVLVGECSIWQCVINGKNPIYQVTKRQRICRFLFVVVWQTIYEVALVLLKNVDIRVRFLSADFLIVVFWMLLYVVLAYPNKKGIGVTAAIVIVVLITNVVIDFYWFNTISQLSRKYLETSSYLRRYLKNPDFIHTVKTAISQIVICVGLVTCHGKTSNQLKLHPKSEHQGMIKQWGRIDLILGVTYQWWSGAELTEAQEERQAEYYAAKILRLYAETRDHP